MAHRPKEYQLNEGTIHNSGLDYELTMVALFSLCCLENHEQFWLASNPKGIPGFDDIVLYRKVSEETSVTYLIQLKHKNFPSDVTAKEFLKASSKKKAQPFYLKKYMEAYDKLTLEINNPDNQSEIIKHLREARNIKMVLFTNRGVDSCGFLELSSDPFADFLSSSDTGSTYKFINEKLPFKSDLFDHLVLLANQADAHLAEKLLNKKLKEVLGFSEVSSDHLQLYTKKFKSFIQLWARGELGGNYPLTETQVTNHLLCIVLNNYIVKFNAVSDERCDLSTWHEIVSSTPMTIVNSEDRVYNFLNKYIWENVSKKLVNYKSGKSICWNDKGYSLQQNLHKELKTFVPKGAKATLLTIYTFLWTHKYIPLVLKVNNIQEYDHIVNALALSDRSLTVIIINNTGKTFSNKTIPVFQTLQDLNVEHQSRVMGKAAQLQGKLGIKLEEFIDDTMLPYVSSSDIISILANNFNIGDVLERVPEYLINRKMSQVPLNPIVVNALTEEFFIIDAISDHYNSANVKIIKRSLTLNQLELLAPPNTTVHHLKYENGKLLWIQSHGAVKNIQKYRIEPKEDDFEPIAVDISRRTVILSASPGMGKSLLIDYLAYQQSPDLWVLKIDLNHFKSYYKTNKCKNAQTSAVDHLIFFSDTILTEKSGSKLAKAVFLKFLEKKRILVLLDGFDEVSGTYIKEVTNIAKALRRDGFCTWITTRPHMALHLEKELDSLSVSLKPFTVEEQEEVLNRYFNEGYQNEKVKEFVVMLLEAAKANLSDRDGEFTGVPLQTKLLAEVFEKDCRTYLSTGTGFNKRFDLLYLYQSFMEKKINVLCRKFGDVGAENYMMFERHLYLFALEFLFPLNEFKRFCELTYSSFYEARPQNIELLLRSGLLRIDESFNISFVHRTFAEYLSAKWLSESFDDEENINVKRGAQFLLNNRFDWNHNFLFNIFDRIMARNHPLHLSIINGQLSKTQELLISTPHLLHSVDALGRSPLHMITVYGNYNPSHSLNEYLLYLNGTNDELDNITEYILSNNEVENCDKLGYNALDYALASGCLPLAEKICAKSNTLPINVNNYSDDEDFRKKYFLYTGRLGYKNVFKALLRYFAFNDLLNRVVEANTCIYSYCLDCLDESDTQIDYVKCNISTYLKEMSISKLWELFTKGCYAYWFLKAISESNVYFLMRGFGSLDFSNLPQSLRIPPRYAVIYQRASIGITNNQYVKSRSTIHKVPNCETLKTTEIKDNFFNFLMIRMTVDRINSLSKKDSGALVDRAEIYVTFVNSQIIDILLFQAEMHNKKVTESEVGF